MFRIFPINTLKHTNTHTHTIPLARPGQREHPPPTSSPSHPHSNRCGALMLRFKICLRLHAPARPFRKVNPPGAPNSLALPLVLIFKERESKQKDKIRAGEISPNVFVPKTHAHKRVRVRAKRAKVRSPSLSLIRGKKKAQKNDDSASAQLVSAAILILTGNDYDDFFLGDRRLLRSVPVGLVSDPWRLVVRCPWPTRV